MNNLIRVTRHEEFETAHLLPGYNGGCGRLHGHSYKLEVTVSGPIIEDETNPKCGMIIDFKDLKKIVNEVAVDKYDHSYLNDYFPNPTAEIMVKQIAVLLGGEVSVESTFDEGTVFTFSLKLKK